MENKLKIVIDTNIFLVIIFERFKHHWIFEALLAGNFELYLSNEILTEYQEVLASKYGLASVDAVLDFLLLLKNVKLVTPYYKWKLIYKDADDDKFVDCAFAANADLILTNDKHFTDYNGLR